MLKYIMSSRHEKLLCGVGEKIETNFHGFLMYGYLKNKCLAVDSSARIAENRMLAEVRL